MARSLAVLEAELKRLEAEYKMFFAGRLQRPPWQTRARVEAMVKRLDQARLQNTGERFRFESLQSRLSAFINLWDRAQRAREEGRPGPLMGTPPAPAAARPADRIVHVATFTDPLRESDKLRGLYDKLVEARREIGQDNVPFHRFAELVRSQVRTMKDSGCPEVAFRVAMKEGKVAFTARALKGMKKGER
jgi:hypothetical protein